MESNPGAALRLLILTNRFEPGGVTNVVLDLARQLRERHVVSLGALSASINDRDIRAEFPELAIGITAIRRAIKSVDLVNSHQRSPATIVRIIAPRVPTVEHVHNEFSNLRVISFRSHETVAVSSRIAERLFQTYPHIRERPHVILNGIPDPNLPPTKSASDSIRIVAAGRLSEQKDPLRFVDLVAAIAALDPTVQATWVGDGALEANFVERVSHLDLHRNIRLLRWESREALLSRIRAASALVMTSAWEGLPLVALESFAVGTPVLTTDCGDLPDYVRASGAGRVWENDVSTDDFARIAHDYLIEQSEHDSAIPRGLYEREFTAERMAMEVEHVYNGVVR